VILCERYQLELKHEIFILQEFLCHRALHLEMCLQVSQVKLLNVIELLVEGRVLKVEGQQQELL